MNTWLYPILQTATGLVLSLKLRSPFLGSYFVIWTLQRDHFIFE